MAITAMASRMTVPIMKLWFLKIRLRSFCSGEGSITSSRRASPTFGVFAGAGVDIAIVFVDLKYEWSLTDVSKVTDFDLGKSRSFYASAGVRIPF